MLSTEQMLSEGPYGPVGSSGPDASNASIQGLGPGSLARFVGSGTVRPELADVLAWTDQLLAAVHGLHTKAQPIFHTGISPSTVYLDEAGDIQLRTIREAKLPTSPDTEVNYKPLEILWDGLDHVSQRALLNGFDEEGQRWLTQPPTPACDIYSVGATVYAVLTGTAPPDALDRSIASMEGKSDPLVDPRTLAPTIPVEISEVILKAMAVQRDDRYYSAVILRQVFKTATVRVRERLEASASEQPVDEVAESPVEEVLPDKAVKINSLEAAPAEKLDQPTSNVAAEVRAEAPATAQDAKDQIAQTTHTAVGEPEADTGAFLGSMSADAAGRSKMPLVAVAVAVIILAIAAGVYKFAGASKTEPAPLVSRSAVEPSEQPKPEPSAVAAVPTAAEQPPVSEPASDTQVLGPNHPKQAKTVAAPQPETSKKVQAPAKAPAPKKQVTVDDLINDN